MRNHRPPRTRLLGPPPEPVAVTACGPVVCYRGRNSPKPTACSEIADAAPGDTPRTVSAFVAYHCCPRHALAALIRKRICPDASTR